MSSPHDSPAVNGWFRRFDAASRHLPAEERASQREEIQQHLEGLVAAEVAQGQPISAAWEAALRQFGDPTQIGRKMYQEWQQGRTGFHADMKAILFGSSLYVVSQFVYQLLFGLWRNRLHTHGAGMVGLPLVVNMILTCGGAILINVPIGLKYPLQALRGAFYANIVSYIWFWVLVILVAFAQPTYNLPHLFPTMFVHSLLQMPVWITGHVAIAYLASVTKRGWYKPSLADFKLTLPYRRPQPSR